MSKSRVVIVSEDTVLIEELVSFIEGSGVSGVEVARSAQELAEHLGDGVVVVVSDSLAADLASSSLANSLVSSSVILIGKTLSPIGLRSALVLGSRTSVVWPDEKPQLKRAIEAAMKQPSSRAPGSATLMWSPKGGSGASVLGAHLSAALSKLGAGVTLCDLDVLHGDQKTILGADHEGDVTDLLRVVHELGPQSVDGVAWRHPAGFRVLFGPDSPGEGGLVKGPDLAQLVGGLRGLGGHWVLDAPSGLSDISVNLAEEAQRTVLVITPDLLSLKRGREAMKLLRSAGLDPARISVVLNRYSSGQVSPADVEAVMGVSVTLTVRLDGRLEHTPDRGELTSGGIALVEPLARKILGRPSKTKSRGRGVFRR